MELTEIDKKIINAINNYDIHKILEIMYDFNLDFNHNINLNIFRKENMYLFDKNNKYLNYFRGFYYYSEFTITEMHKCIILMKYDNPLIFLFYHFVEIYYNLKKYNKSKYLFKKNKNKFIFK